MPQNAYSEKKMSTSVDERDQAIRIAKSMFESLNNSIAIGPSIEKDFLPDFSERLLTYEPSRLEEYVDPAFASSLTPAEFRRFFIVSTELFLIGTMYSLEQLNSKTEKSKGAYPPGVLPELMRDPQLRNALKNDLPIKTKALFEIQLDSTERAVAKGREYLLRRSTNTKERYMSSLSRLEKRQRNTRGELFQPSLKYYKEGHFGFPAGTKFIWIDIPIFRLELVESQGILKVLDIGPYIQ